MSTLLASWGPEVTGSERAYFCEPFCRLGVMPVALGFNARMKTERNPAAERDSAQALAAGLAPVCDRTTGHVLPMFADMVRGVETYLLNPARQLGMDRVRGRDNPESLADPSGALSIRNAFSAEGFLRAGREKGAV